MPQENKKPDELLALRRELRHRDHIITTYRLMSVGFAVQLERIAQQCHLAANPFKWEFGDQLQRIAKELQNVEKDIRMKGD